MQTIGKDNLASKTCVSSSSIYLFNWTIILLCFVFIVKLYSQKSINVLEEKTVCIDAGHGGTAGTDSFRVGLCGEREEWINLRVALHLKKMLKIEGVKVVITRAEDVAVGLKDRALMAVENKADVFVSIHHNATADTSVNFPIIYFHGNASENLASVQLGKLVSKNIYQQLYNSKTPVSLASDYVIFPSSGTAVLRHSYGIPGIIGEASFFTNPEEEQKLKDNKYNKKEAKAYYFAILEFLKQKSFPIFEKYSQVRVDPFPVLQEADRMSEVAKLWQQDFEQGKKLFDTGNSDSLRKALDIFTRSVRSFPDSWLAPRAHYYRAQILDKIRESEKAYMETLRIREHHPLHD